MKEEPLYKLPYFLVGHYLKRLNMLDMQLLARSRPLFQHHRFRFTTDIDTILYSMQRAAFSIIYGLLFLQLMWKPPLFL